MESDFHEYKRERDHRGRGGVLPRLYRVPRGRKILVNNNNHFISLLLLQVTVI